MKFSSNRVLQSSITLHYHMGRSFVDLLLLTLRNETTTPSSAQYIAFVNSENAAQSNRIGLHSSRTSNRRRSTRAFEESCKWQLARSTGIPHRTHERAASYQHQCSSTTTYRCKKCLPRTEIATEEADSLQMAWSIASSELLDTYRVAHNLPSPAAFTSPLRQALLTNSGIGRQSPTMARKKEKRRVSKDQLALAVRKNFNGAAVNEIDVVVELVYKVRNQDKSFRMRSTPGAKKAP